MTRNVVRFLAISSLVFLVGCGGAGQERTVPAGGVVTYNGTPVSGAIVVFGAASEQPRSATGITDEAGRFELSTYGENDGAIVGTYAVTITKREAAGGMTEDEEHEAISAGRDIPEAEARDSLPRKYGDAKTSELTAEVTADGPNQFEFALTD